MKKHTFTLLLGWLLLITANLNAQNKEGRVNLKEGDWFEVAVEQNYSTTFTFSDKKQEQLKSIFYLLNYQLIKHYPDKNQQYKIYLEHRKEIFKYDDRFFGFDSYYPDFIENRNHPLTKNEFLLTVNPNGKILEFISPKNNSRTAIIYSEIRQSKSNYGAMAYSETNSDSLLISIFSQILMQKDSTFNNKYISESGIALIIKQSNLQLTLTNASFALPPNALIHGKLNDQMNQEITISLKGENPEYNFPEKHFKTNYDGSFECPVFLKKPLHLKIRIGHKSLTTFMVPGDTLNIHAIGHQAREIQNQQYAETKPNEYYSQGIEKSDYFTGNAAYNTMLSNELDQYRNGFVYEKEVSAVIKKDIETKQAVNQLIESYRGKASKKCI